jgi:hypothetical protein
MYRSLLSEDTGREDVSWISKDALDSTSVPGGQAQGLDGQMSDTDRNGSLLVQRSGFFMSEMMMSGR